MSGDRTGGWAWPAVLALAAFAAAGCAERGRGPAAGGSADSAGTTAEPAVADTGAIGDEAAIGPWTVRILGSTEEPQVARFTRPGRPPLEVTGSWRVSLVRAGTRSSIRAPT
jgi:hypothetical protein